VTEQILVVEGQPTARRDVVRNSRPIKDNVVERAQPPAVAPACTVELEDALEVAEKLGQAYRQETLRAPFGCRLLFLVGIVVAEWVMRVKDLQVEFEDRGAT
jgi:hypothetical protein